MYINPAWRILTIGDGDLSFSSSLSSYYKPRELTATIFDDKHTLLTKYGDKHYQQLLSEDVDVLLGFDVTNETTWGSLKKNHYDVVIFQFPLLPAFSSSQEFIEQCDNVSINTLNRHLLRTYLLNCFKYFLSDNGAKLAFITSKDVKPYQQWDIEKAITIDTDIHFIGKINFDINKFPGYKIRNVDRNKHVKATQGISYIYSTGLSTELSTELNINTPSSLTSVELQDNCCLLCKTGIFTTELDKTTHLATKKHQQMLKFEQQWLHYLQQKNTLFNQQSVNKGKL